MKKWLWFGLIGILLAPDLHAQAVATPTDVEVHVYRAADDPAGVPFRTQVVPVTALVCNLLPTATPTVTVINPRSLEFDDWDVTHVGKACQVNVATFVQSLPVATGYRATARYFSAAGPSLRSNVTGPFDVAPVPPAAPTRVGVRP